MWGPKMLFYSLNHSFVFEYSYIYQMVLGDIVFLLALLKFCLFCEILIKIIYKIRLWLNTLAGLHFLYTFYMLRQPEYF